MIVLVSREARQVEHDHEMHAALIQPAIREQVLKLVSISGLGALAFLVKPFDDFVSLAAAVLLAGAKLGRQAEILGLFLRKSPAVLMAVCDTGTGGVSNPPGRRRDRRGRRIEGLLTPPLHQ